MFFTFRRVIRARALLWQTDRSCHVSMSSLTSWTSPRKSLSLSSMWVDNAKQVRMGNHSVWVALDMRDEDRKTNVRCSLKQAHLRFRLLIKWSKFTVTVYLTMKMQPSIDSGDRDDTRLCAYAQALSISWWGSITNFSHSPDAYNSIDYWKCRLNKDPGNPAEGYVLSDRRIVRCSKSHRNHLSHRELEVRVDVVLNALQTALVSN